MSYLEHLIGLSRFYYSNQSRVHLRNYVSADLFLFFLSRLLQKYANALGEFSKTGLWNALVQKQIRLLLLRELSLRWRLTLRTIATSRLSSLCSVTMGDGVMVVFTDTEASDS